MDEPVRGVRRLERASELIVLALACLAPWALGAVRARVQFALELGIAVLAVLGALLAWKAPRYRRSLVCVPSLALAGLALLGFVQSVSLPPAVVKTLAPATYALRASLVPKTTEVVVGDEAPPVAAPRSTLSLDPETSFRTATQLAAAWILFQAVINLGGGYASFRRLGLAVAVNATLLALFSIIQAQTWNGKIYWIVPSPWPLGHYAGGPFVCHNHLAAYLNIGLGFALGFFLPTAAIGRAGGERRALDWGHHLWLAYAAGLILAGLFGTHSRGGFLALVVASSATFLLLRGEAVRLRTGLLLMLLMVPLFLVAVGNSSPFQHLSTIPGQISKGLGGDPEGLQTRVEAWKGALEAWRRYPILGSGLGTFPVATIPFYNHDRGTYYYHAENEYLQTLVEGGIIGLALGLIALGTSAVLAWRARSAAPTPRDRLLVTGGLLGGLALAFQCLSDFTLHVPGVAVVGVILCASLCRLGLDARGGDAMTSIDRGRRALALVPIHLTLVVLSLAILLYGFRLARAESFVMSVGLPVPGASLPGPEDMDMPQDELLAKEAALEEALALRPDWAEGHLHLGNAHLALYRRVIRDWFEKAGKDDATKETVSNPLWLHQMVHASTPEQLAASGNPLHQKPVQDDLAPAARSFLEARRCCPSLALPHLRLAALDFLLTGGDGGSASIARALQQAGPDIAITIRAAQVAFQLNDPSLAARCWSKILVTSGVDWRPILDVVHASLEPDQILREVLPDGSKARFAIRFIDRFYDGKDEEETREKFARAALEALPGERGLSPAERSWLEAQISARLGDIDAARAQMIAALVAEPPRDEWRAEFAGWLIRWGDYKEAHRQALIGLHYAPDRLELKQALAIASDAEARQTPAGSGTRKN